MEKLSVVIATINDSIATNLTVAQIMVQLEQDEIPYEIVIVDNGSDEVELENIKKFVDFHRDFPVSLHHCQDRGTIPPHSFGVLKATGTHITMPDPHMVFSTHYFRVMMETLKEYQPKGFEVVFSPFSVGSITKKNGEYICASHLVKPNPFGRTTSVGESCKFGIEPFPVLSNSIAGVVMSKSWLLEIGNMFPDAFSVSGGHTAESLMIGIPTWMMGKKCLVQPSAVIEHPTYRTSYGGGRNANMHLSMATAAYICGGEKYLGGMVEQYGKFVDGQLEEIPKLSASARNHIQEHQKISLDELIENWEKIRYA